MLIRSLALAAALTAQDPEVSVAIQQDPLEEKATTTETHPLTQPDRNRNELEGLVLPLALAGGSLIVLSARLSNQHLENKGWRRGLYSRF